MFKWDIERVAAVINAGSPEGQSLEFKSALPANSDKGKAEFLKDVSAIANAAGGAILFGIVEKAGAAESLAGLTIDDPDAEIRRLSQILESGIEPRIGGIRLESLALGDSDVIVVDVPQSFDAPHRYNFNGHSKFVQRVGSHVSELTFDQLRSAFDRSGQRLSAIRNAWRNDFDQKRMWRPLANGPVCIVRVSSLLSADGRQAIDPQSAMSNWSDLVQPNWMGGSPSYNYEGLVVAPSRDEILEGFTQVHRIGAITSYCVVGTEWKGERLLVAARNENFIMDTVPRSLRFLENSGIAGSAVIHIGIVGLGGHKLAITEQGYDRTVSGNVWEIQLPEILIEDLSKDFDRHTKLRDGFDLIWQTFGQANCRNYRPGGIWEIR